MKSLQELIAMYHEEESKDDIIDSYPRNMIHYSDDWHRYIDEKNSKTGKIIFNNSDRIYIAMIVVYWDDPEFLEFEKIFIR